MLRSATNDCNGMERGRMLFIKLRFSNLNLKHIPVKARLRNDKKLESIVYIIPNRQKYRIISLGYNY